MPFLKRANLIVPGYAMLSDDKRARFEATAPGREFAANINAQLEAFEAQSFIDWVLFDLLQSEESHQEQLGRIRHAMLLTDDYENLINDINHATLERAYPDFQLLNDDKKNQLSRADCSRILFPDVPRLLTSFSEKFALEQDKFIHHQVTQVIREFEREMASDPTLAVIQNHIAEEKYRIQAQAKKNAVNKFYHRYIPNPAQESVVILAEEQEQLTAFIVAILNENTVNTLDLHAFNRVTAQHLSTLIVEAWDNELDHHLDDVLQSYEQSLQAQVQHHLGTIHGERDTFQSHSLQQNAAELLSYIYTHSLSEENKNLFFSTLDKIADAHAFIQATGFATQNENSNLSWLDIYNYSRSKEYIAESKKDMYRFFHPFMPIFAEYRDISQHEQNVVRQIIRTLMPLLIVAAVVVLVSTLLSSIIISETAFLFILLPTLYIAGVIATSYVLTKDNLYHSVRQLYYGGAYAIPEYQVNARMEAGFNSPERARQVREFYTDEIKRCYETEARYQHMQPGTLTDMDQHDRKDNAQRKDLLLLEWYDIHSNTAVGCNRISDIILKRIQQDGLKACEQSAIADPEGIQAWTTDILNGIRTTIHRLHDNIDAPMALPARNRFFTPPCIEQQMKAEKLNALKEELVVQRGPV